MPSVSGTGFEPSALTTMICAVALPSAFWNTRRKVILLPSGENAGSASLLAVALSTNCLAAPLPSAGMVKMVPS